MPGAVSRDLRPAKGALKVDLGLRAVGTVAGMLTYAFALQYAFKWAISPEYSYQGFVYRSPDTWDYGACIALALAVALWVLPRRLNSASDLIQWLLFLQVGAPSILVGQYVEILSSQQALILAINVSVAFVLIRLALAAVPVARWSIPASSVSTLAVVSASILFPLYGYMLGRGLLRLNYLGFYDVYDVRRDFYAAVGGDFVIAYVAPIAFNALNPLLIVVGIASRRLVPFAVGLGGQVVLYASIGHKTIILSTLVAVLLPLLYRRPFGVRFLWGVAIGTVAFIVVDRLLGGVEFTNTFVRRFMAYPGVLSNAYVDTFAGMPKTHFQESFFPWLANPYDRSPAALVSDRFLGNPYGSANSGFIAHGYASWGYFGIHLEALVVAALAWLANVVTRTKDRLLVAGALFMPAGALSESAATTAALTHAFFAAVILCAFVPSIDALRNSAQTRG